MIKAKTTRFFLKAALLTLIFGGFGLYAEESQVKALVQSEWEAVAPGETLTLLVEAKLAPTWHLYWKNPGDSGMAPSFEWQLPEGVTLKQVHWSQPKRFETDGLVTFGYEEKAYFLVDLDVSKEFQGNSVDIKADFSWIVCSSDTCLPGQSSFETHVKVGASQKSSDAPSIEAMRKSLPQILTAHAVHQEGDLLFISLPKETQKSETLSFYPEEPLDAGNVLDLSLDANNEETVVSLKSNQQTPLKGLVVIGSQAFHLDQTVAMAEPHIAPAISLEESLTFAGALFFALLGGLLLNLMPCVLPVVSLKIMSFVKMGSSSRAETARHGVAFTAGVLLSFFALASLLLIFQAMGQAVGWGFQLQDPFFIAMMAILFTMLALNLFGVFELGTSLAGLAGEVQGKTPKDGYSKSFISGIFATAVATPCTGPFMGSALGYAIAQPAYVSFAIFGALGLGMSLPYLLIGFYPALIRFLPKPGAWMESFKQSLGFMMLCSVLWLLWVFVGQTAENSLFALLFALLIASVGAWVYGRFGALNRSRKVRKIGYIVAALCLAGAVFISWKAVPQQESASAHTEIAEGEWEPFSAERLAALRAEGTPVFIDFTAKWCLVCQANHLTLSKEDVKGRLAEKGVVKMKADWTKYDAAITNELKKHGRNGVPLYVLYGDKEKPTILPQLLTPETVLSSLEENVKTDVR